MWSPSSLMSSLPISTSLTPPSHTGLLTLTGGHQAYSSANSYWYFKDHFRCYLFQVACVPTHLNQVEFSFVLPTSVASTVIFSTSLYYYDFYVDCLSHKSDCKLLQGSDHIWLIRTIFIRATVIETVFKDRPKNQKRVQELTHIYGQLIFYQGAKRIQWGKASLF